MLRAPCVLAVACVLACGGNGSKTPGAIGADCSVGRDSACASSTCLVLDSSTAYCSQSCQSQTDCPNGFLCAAASQGGNFCQALGAGGICGADADCPAGETCDTKGSHCYIPVTRADCGPCTSDLQCGAGGSCHAETSGERYCAQACGTSSTCPSGYTCAGNVCLPATGSCRGARPLCAPCAGDIECGGPGDLCVRNVVSQETFCGTKCTQNSDCAAHFSCVDLSGLGAGPFQCVPDSQTCAGFCDAAASDTAAIQRECGLGSTCDLANHVCKRLTDGSLCATCASDDDCVTTSNPNSACLINNGTGERFCGADCSQGCTDPITGAGCSKNAAACSAQFECVGIGANGTWPFQCAPIRGSCTAHFGKLGDSCEKNGADDCISDVCARFGTEKECTATCTIDSDCGDPAWRCCASAGTTGYDCSQAPASSGGGICAPIGGSFGDDCSPGNAPCEEGLCLNLGTAQFCTQSCDATHTCPANFTCQAGTLEQSDGTLGSTVQVCFPNGGGTMGSDCTYGPAACQSHLCLKKESGNVCTQKCTVDADCLPAGSTSCGTRSSACWTCKSELEPDGTQVQVCLPPGVTP